MRRFGPLESAFLRSPQRSSKIIAFEAIVSIVLGSRKEPCQFREDPT